MYQCLVDRDVPARLDQTSRGEPLVGWERDSFVLGQNLEGQLFFEQDADADPLDQEDMEQYSHDGADPWLVIDGKDYSEAFADCLSQTNYREPYGEADPAERLARMQAIAEASNSWAECARDFGLRDVADADGPVLGDSGTPTVYIPASIQPEQLRALVKQCPTFDAEAELAMAKRASEDPDEYVAPPRASLGFKAISGGGRGFATTPADPPLDGVDPDVLAELWLILEEDYNALWQDHEGINAPAAAG
jgi:hypothetical protein